MFLFKVVSFQQCDLFLSSYIRGYSSGQFSNTVYKREREVANALEKLASLQALPDLSPPMHQLLFLNGLLN